MDSTTVGYRSSFVMDDILDYNFPSIIRLLDIMTIGPYLVKHNILHMDEYYNDYQCALASHYSYNAKLLPKLATKLKKYPQNFITALEECVMNEQCDGHNELLTILQDYMQSSQSVKKHPAYKRQHRNNRNTAQRKHMQNSSGTAVSTPVHAHEVCILGSISASQQEEDVEDHIFMKTDLASEPAGNEVYKLTNKLHSYKSTSSQPRSELVYGGYPPNRRNSYIHDQYRSTLVNDNSPIGSFVMNDDEDVVVSDIAKPTSAESTVPTEMITFDNEMINHVQHSSVMNMYTTSTSHSDCEEKHEHLKSFVNNLEQKFHTKIEELENLSEAHELELRRLNKELQSNNKHKCKSHCHVMVPKQTICYCYAQVGAHSHYVAENYSKQQ